MKRTIKQLLCITLVFININIAQSQEIDFDKVEITSVPVVDDIYMLMGEGGNIGVFIGDDGIFMIDDQYAPLTDKILAAIRDLSTEQIRFLVNTHWHFDHSGGNENLGNHGVLIAAHDNVYARMTTEQNMQAFNRIIPPSPRAAHPVITYDSTMTFNINGDKVSVIYVSNAHTDGDSILYFNNANVIHMGDTFFSGFYPFIDFSSGGSIDGMIAAANKVMEIADADTKIIPGHGPLSNEDDLQEYKSMLVAARDRVGKLKSEGKSLEAIQAAKPMADYDAIYGKAFINPETFLMLVYNTLP